MRTFSLAAVLGACLALAAPASAKIVVQKSIAGVRLGMDEAQVRAVLGEPSGAEEASGEIGDTTILQYRGRGIAVLLFHAGGTKQVTAIEVSARGEKTSRGSGVGTSEKKLRKDLKGERCESDGGFRSCWVGSRRPGRVITEFVIRKGKVQRVTLGRVID